MGFFFFEISATVKIYYTKGGITVVDRKTWDKIRNEYIKGGTSYRKLSEKYHVSLKTLSDKASAEKWHEAMLQKRNKSAMKIAESLANGEAEQAKKDIEIINDIYDINLKKLKQQAEKDKISVYERESIVRTVSKIREEKGIKPKSEEDHGGITINIIRNDKEVV